MIQSLRYGHEGHISRVFLYELSKNVADVWLVQDIEINRPVALQPVEFQSLNENIERIKIGCFGFDLFQDIIKVFLVIESKQWNV